MAEASARDWRRAGAFAALISLLVCSAVVINGGTRPVELGSVAPQEAIAQPPPLPAAAAHPEALALAGGAVAAQPSTTENAGSSSSPPSSSADDLGKIYLHVGSNLKDRAPFPPDLPLHLLLLPNGSHTDSIYSPLLASTLTHSKGDRRRKGSPVEACHGAAAALGPQVPRQVWPGGERLGRSEKTLPLSQRARPSSRESRTSSRLHASTAVPCTSAPLHSNSSISLTGPIQPTVQAHFCFALPWLCKAGG